MDGTAATAAGLWGIWFAVTLHLAVKEQIPVLVQVKRAGFQIVSGAGLGTLGFIWKTMISSAMPPTVSPMTRQIRAVAP